MKNRAFLILNLLLTNFLISSKGYSIEPPAIVGDSSNIILWLHPDSGVYNSSNLEATVGQDVAQWRDISGNGFIFTNAYTNRRPVLTTHNSKRYLDFTSGDFFENTVIRDSINGLDEFSIFITIKSDQTNTDKGFMDSENPNGTDDKICLRYDSRGANTGRTNLLKTGMNGNTAANQVETQSNTQTTNVQTLTLVWKDGERLLVYINGVLNDSSSATLAAPLAGVNKIILGKGPKDTGGGLGGGSGWDGLIGQVIFYNKKYSADTIQQVASQISSIQSISSGLWNSPSTWDCNCTPLDTYDVVINNGHNITLNANSEARNITINSGGSLDLSSSNYSLTVNQHLNAQGSLNTRNANLIFSGSQTSYSTGTFNAHNLIISKSSGSLMRVQSGRISISNELQVNTGTFDANNKTTLLSQATGTARLAPVSGSITGSMTVQRYIPSTGSNLGYRHFSTPFSNSTLANFQYNSSSNSGGVVTYGFTGSNYPSAGGYVSTYGFVEANAVSGNDFNAGWNGVTSATQAIGYNNAYTFYSGGSNYPSYSISVTGTPNTGTRTISNLSYTGSGVLSGWHMIGNPYASTIDWGAVSKTGVDAIAYVFEPSQGGYIASNLLPDNNLISSYQGFFIHVNNSTNSIQFEESDKSSQDAPYVRSQQKANRLRISAHNLSNGVRSIAALDFNEYATDGFNVNYDAYRIDNPSNYPDMYFDQGGEKLQVNTVSDKTQKANFDLNITNATKAKMRIWIEEVPEINGCLAIMDNKTQMFYPITDSMFIDVEIDPADSNMNRFTIELLNTIKGIKTNNETCSYSNDGSVELTFNNLSGNWNIKNQKDELVYADFFDSALVSNLPAGYYTINWEAEHCGTFSDYFFITQPEEIIADFDIPSSVEINETVIPQNFSTGAKTYQWLLNESIIDSSALTELTMEIVGEYNLTLNAMNGACSHSSSKKIAVVDNSTLSNQENENYTAVSVWLNGNKLNWKGIENVNQVELLNSLGQLVESSSPELGSSHTDLQQVANGNYIVRLTSEEQVVNVKVAF